VFQLKDFEKLVQESTQALAKIVIQDQPPSNNLLPNAVREKQVQLELESNIKNMERKMAEGLQACLTCLEHCQNLPLTREAVVAELKTCMAKISTPKDISELGQAMLSNTK